MRPMTTAGGAELLGPDLAHLPVAAPEAALPGLGQRGEAAPAARPWRTRPRTQLGLGGGRPAARLPRHRPGPARPRRLRLGGRLDLLPDRLRPRHGAAAQGRGPLSGDHRRALARRLDLAALHRHLPRAGREGGRDRGARSVAADDRVVQGHAGARAHAHLGARDAVAGAPPRRTTTRPSRRRSRACARPIRASPRSRHAT